MSSNLIGCVGVHNEPLSLLLRRDSVDTSNSSFPLDSLANAENKTWRFTEGHARHTQRKHDELMTWFSSAPLTWFHPRKSMQCYHLQHRSQSANSLGEMEIALCGKAEVGHIAFLKPVLYPGNAVATCCSPLWPIKPQHQPNFYMFWLPFSCMLRQETLELSRLLLSEQSFWTENWAFLPPGGSIFELQVVVGRF